MDGSWAHCLGELERRACDGGLFDARRLLAVGCGDPVVVGGVRIELALGRTLFLQHEVRLQVRARYYGLARRLILLPRTHTPRPTTAAITRNPAPTATANKPSRSYSARSVIATVTLSGTVNAAAVAVVW